MKYSVIIPVFNAENTIAHCLDSLLVHGRNDMEIVLVNDGSADRSDAICRAYAENHSEIRYFFQENGGVSSARNLGLSVAVGDYILFVDSDDWVSEEYFFTIDKCLEDHPADLIQFSWKSVKNDNYSASILSYRYLQIDALSNWAYHAMQDGSFGSLWSKVFTRQIIAEHKLRFVESLKIAEDWVFIFQYLLYCESYFSIPDPLYIVSLENDSSLSRKKREYLSDQLYDANIAIYKSILEGLPRTTSFQKPLSLSYYRSVYSASKELHKFNLSNKECRKHIKEICDKYTSGPIAAKGFLPVLLAVPVRLKLSFLIFCLISRGKQ